MKKILKRISIFMALVAVSAIGALSCTPNGGPKPNGEQSTLAIVYDNDVHCNIEAYAQLASVRSRLYGEVDYVATVSSGDYLSGGMVSAISQGDYIVDIMNNVGYDVVALGNHEFDYGMENLITLSGKLEAKTVCANLVRVNLNERVYPAYHIVNYGETKVAFLGLTTTTSALAKVVNDESGNAVYSFMYGDAFYANAQSCIDQARREGADYVVALAHLGEKDKSGEHPSSLDLIAATTGLDVVIDGHDHSVINERIAFNKEGKEVLLTSSGSEFANVGVVTLDSDGKWHSKLVDLTGEDVQADASVEQFIKGINDKIDGDAQCVIGRSEVLLSIKDGENNRIVRKQECNIGNLCADAFRVLTGADVAMVNGGGVRSDIGVGDITYKNIYNVMPFGDKVYTATMTGQQLSDALEYAVSFLPKEAGVFMQVSGMSFDVNANIPSPVQTIEEGGDEMFVGVGEGARRISNLKILNKNTAVMESVDLVKTYSVASLDYLILEQGGSGVLRYSTPLDFYYSDVECVASYIKDVLKGVVGSQYATTEGRICFVNQ